MITLAQYVITDGSRWKNEIQILNIILDKKISDTVTNEILESMSKIDKRTYEPRVMNELFDL